jgi:hypothetical protein
MPTAPVHSAQVSIEKSMPIPQTQEQDLGPEVPARLQGATRSLLFIQILAGNIILRQLATLYRTRVPFNGAKWRMQNGQMRWQMNYNNVVPWEFHAAFFIDGRYHDLRRSASSRRPGNRRLCARHRLGFGNCSIKK